MFGVLLDEEHRQPFLGVQHRHDPEELGDDDRREAERRLVEQQQPRPRDAARARARASAARRRRACRPAGRARSQPREELQHAGIVGLERAPVAHDLRAERAGSRRRSARRRCPGPPARARRRAARPPPGRGARAARRRTRPRPTGGRARRSRAASSSCRRRSRRAARRPGPPRPSSEIPCSALTGP